jgi:hypothetical protein
MPSKLKQMPRWLQRGLDHFLLMWVVDRPSCYMIPLSAKMILQQVSGHDHSVRLMFINSLVDRVYAPAWI